LRTENPHSISRGSRGWAARPAAFQLRKERAMNERGPRRFNSGTSHSYGAPGAACHAKPGPQLGCHGRAFW